MKFSSMMAIAMAVIGSPDAVYVDLEPAHRARVEFLEFKTRIGFDDMVADQECEARRVRRRQRMARKRRRGWA